MTIVAAYDDGQNLWIASDSCGFANDMKAEYGSKLVRFGNFVIGLAASYRIFDIIQESINHNSTIRDVQDIRDFRDIIKNNLLQYTGASSCDHDNDETHPVSILIICSLGIYEIQGDYAILYHKDGYAAIGSGENFAFGALAFAKLLGLSHKAGFEGKEIIRDIIKATEKHCIGTGGKIYIEKLEG